MPKNFSHKKFRMNSPCPPPVKFIITRTKTALEPYIYTVERFGTTGAPLVKIRCMGQHELKGFLNGAGVDVESIDRVLSELESSDRAEVEASSQ
jgi:hypothetical protein